MTRLRWLLRAACAATGWSLAWSAALADTGTEVHRALQRKGLLDPYSQQFVLDVALPLAQVSKRFAGVQVNGPYRSDWVNIYIVDGQRLPEGENLLDAEGFPNVNRGTLRGGALSQTASAIVLLDSAAMKRFVTATVMKLAGEQPSIMSALAVVDLRGVANLRRYWAEDALAADNSLNRRTGMLMRGSLGYVLAHEMGHLLQTAPSAPKADNGPARLLRLQRLQRLEARQRNEAKACDEFADAQAIFDREVERQADRMAASLIGQQCQVGSDGRIRHQELLLGMNWTLMAAMADKLFDMGAVSTSPRIRQYLVDALGPSLYEPLMTARRSQSAPGGAAVEVAYPASHPPDAERVRALEAALAQTPCGGSGMDNRDAQLLEQMRASMCRQLDEAARPR